MQKFRFLALLLALGLVLPYARPLHAAQDAAAPYVVTGTYKVTNSTAIQSGIEVQAVMGDLGSEVLHDNDLRTDPKGVVVGTAQGTTEAGTYRMPLPLKPGGPLFKLDKAAPDKQGVGVYVISYGDNPTGLDITNDAYFSSMGGSYVYNDEQRKVTGGKLFVWSPDEGEKFPTGFGDDAKLFTDDDPLAEIPAGWSMIDLDQKPFAVIRDAELKADMVEGSNAIIDYSKLSYKQAWEALYERGVTHYAFTKLKNLDWPAIKAKIDPLVNAAKNDEDFSVAMLTFATMFDDTHTEAIPNKGIPTKLATPLTGDLGMADFVITSDDKIVVKYVEPRGPAERGGMKSLAVITEINGKPVIEALDATTTLFSGASTPWSKRNQQLRFFLRGTPNSKVTITFQNPDGQPQTVEFRLRSSKTLSNRAPAAQSDPTELVVTGKVLPSGIGYIRINDFYSQRPLEFRLFKQYMQAFRDAKVTGLIIDVRDNPGGWSDTTANLVGFFFQEKTSLGGRLASDGNGGFEKSYTQYTLPQDPYFDGPVAVLVNANSISSADFFPVYMKQSKNGFVVGDTPSSGAGGGTQEFTLPGDIYFQWAETPAVDANGENLLEGKGAALDVTVPITVESVRSGEDVVLKAAEAKIKEGGIQK